MTNACASENARELAPSSNCKFVVLLMQKINSTPTSALFGEAARDRGQIQHGGPQALALPLLEPRGYEQPHAGCNEGAVMRTERRWFWGVWLSRTRADMLPQELADRREMRGNKLLAAKSTQWQSLAMSENIRFWSFQILSHVRFPNGLKGICSEHLGHNFKRSNINVNECKFEHAFTCTPNTQYCGYIFILLVSYIYIILTVPGYCMWV